MRGSRKALSRIGKADLRVRLFLGIGVSLIPVARAEERPVPATWMEAIRSYGEKGNWGTKDPVPAFERELVSLIRERILEASRVSDAKFTSYQSSVPETGEAYEMLAIEGGTYTMGSPDHEKGRQKNEDERQVTVSSFWMGKHEVTWDLFLPFADGERSKNRYRNGAPMEDKTGRIADWISSPTQPYAVPDFGMGLDGGYPAVGMTQHAANKFCQWLSWQTGHFYRLPTEAEWEYACRAGTTGPYSCPINDLSDHAVLDPDQVRVGYEKTGTKNPNPWGLHDMHGNVAEWCLDGYTSDLPYRPGSDPWIRSKQRYPRVVRGGSWYDPPEEARSARRLFSHPHWNVQDPQLPQSLWWLVDAQWVGFRVVRPLTIPSEADMFEAWNTGAMHRQENDVIP